jgi:hypothetical protein
MYFIKGQVNYVLNVSGSRAAFIDKNNSAFISSIWPGSANNFTPAATIAVERLQQGDTLSLRAVQNSGGSIATVFSNGAHASLQVQWLAP